MEEKILDIIRTHGAYGNVPASKEITTMMVGFFTWMYVQSCPYLLHNEKDSTFYNIDTKSVCTLEDTFKYWHEFIYTKKPINRVRTRNVINS